MVNAVPKEKATNISLSGTPSLVRLIEELAFASRVLGKSQLVRLALIEKADRDLPANWREIVGFEESGEAA